LVIYWLYPPRDACQESRPARYFLIAATLFALLFSTMARMVTWLIRCSSSRRDLPPACVVRRRA
jgi:hypothetical protein